MYKQSTMPATTDPPDNHGDGHTRSRLEAEIEEILERAERDHPTAPPISLDEARNARQHRERQEQRSEQLRSIGQSAQRWLTAAPILVAFMLAILANLVSGISPFLANLAVSAAVIAFFFPIAERFRARNTGATTSSRMWRGKDMGPPPEEQGPTPSDQIRDWFRNRRDGA